MATVVSAPARKHVHRLAILAAAVAAVPVTAAVPAQAAVSRPAPMAMSGPAASFCRPGVIKVPSYASNIPIVYGPGHPYVTRTAVRNTSGAAVSGLVFDYEVFPVTGYHRQTPAPTLAWRFGRGKWHSLPVTWYPGKGRQDWESNDTHLGTLAAGARRVLQIRTTFHSGDRSGSYYNYFYFGSTACGFTVLGSGQHDLIYQA
jgi:hypothetical protein